MSDLEPFEKRDFVRRGYTVKPAMNGGFVVSGWQPQHEVPTIFVAFTNHIDLTRWLTEAHVIHASPVSPSPTQTNKEQ